jgi:DNA-binding MarR family transcriptional regulator
MSAGDVNADAGQPGQPGLTAGELTAGELIILGRELTKIGVAAMRGQPARRGEAAIPAGLSMVGADVFAHPATSISEIAERTGLRQSYVSESVARLRDRGVVETAPDPDDGRRTLVRLTAGHPHRLANAAAAPAEAALAAALGAAGQAGDQAAVAEVTGMLALLARLLKPSQPGPAGRYLISDEEA